MGSTRAMIVPGIFKPDCSPSDQQAWMIEGCALVQNMLNQLA